MIEVSVITPTYNSASFIAEAIRSVQNQTFSSWEMIIVDDCSKDNTVDIVREFTLKDSRVKLIELKNNVGPGVARQIAVLQARGRFVAFLDSDDIWLEEKLTKQLDFMMKMHCAFSCTAYEQIDEKNKRIVKTLVPPLQADYDRVLLDCPIGNSTVMYDTQLLGKCFGPNVKNREDFALWLTILKKEAYVWGLPLVLARYRLRRGSVSSNKLKLVYYQWVLYRRVEQLTLCRTIFHICYWGMIKILGLK